MPRIVHQSLTFVLALLCLTAAAQVVTAQEEGEPDAGTAVPQEKAAPAKEKAPPEGNPVVLMKTSMGDIKVRLFRDKAPLSVANFLSYVDDKFYDDTIFHRVMKDFMIQGGGFASDLAKKETRPAIKNEADNGLSNLRGTIAMARTNIVDSATSQFFINVKVEGNKFLDHNTRDFGYAVFGEVIGGMDVVDKIQEVKTGARGPFTADCPVTPVIIESIRLVE